MTCDEIYKVEFELSLDGCTVLSERWTQNDDLSCVGRPAYIEKDRRSGKLQALSWWMHGNMHRADGPANILFHEDGISPHRVEWRLHGKLHRRGGPAIVTFDSEGIATDEEWWAEGHRLSEAK